MADEENTQQAYTSPFDAIREIDEAGTERWSARKLYKILGYTQWRNFNTVVIKRASKACEESGQAVADHFVRSYKPIKGGKGAIQQTEDFLLSRYAAYLVVMNGDPKMPAVALGQQYFAIQTRRQELADQLATLPEDQKRIILRNQMAIFNQQLAEAARNTGVIKPEHFAAFTDHGYAGLYGGLRENDIHARKQLTDKDKILDYMGSEELGANIFRATQADAKLRREEIKGREEANKTHYGVGREVRETIKRLGGTMPENLPTPDKSVQQLQREEQKRIEQQQQPSLFDAPPDEEPST